jgi:hypothetical protein
MFTACNETIVEWSTIEWVRGAPDSDFYYPAGYLKKIRIFYRYDTGYFIKYLTYNIYYKDFSHPCISAEEGDTIF